MVGIILAVNRAYVFLNNTKFAVRSTNFTREGVEMVYNLRDSNRRKCSGNRDKARLYAWDTSGCNNNSILSGWIYTIKEWKINNDTYIYASNLGVADDRFYNVEWFFSEEFSDQRNDSRITFSWEYSYYSGGAMAILTWNMDDLLRGSGIEFYRVLRVFWIYCKNSDSPNETSCSEDTDPKEMRFCVKVFYEVMWWQHATELCSIMTNFME